MILNTIGAVSTHRNAEFTAEFVSEIKPVYIPGIEECTSWGKNEFFEHQIWDRIYPGASIFSIDSFHQYLILTISRNLQGWKSKIAWIGLMRHELWVLTGKSNIQYWRIHKSILSSKFVFPPWASGSQKSIMLDTHGGITKVSTEKVFFEGDKWQVTVSPKQFLFGFWWQDVNI